MRRVKTDRYGTREVLVFYKEEIDPVEIRLTQYVHYEEEKAEPDDGQITKTIRKPSVSMKMVTIGDLVAIERTVHHFQGNETSQDITPLDEAQLVALRDMIELTLMHLQRGD